MSPAFSADFEDGEPDSSQTAARPTLLNTPGSTAAFHHQIPSHDPRNVSGEQNGSGYSTISGQTEFLSGSAQNIDSTYNLSSMSNALSAYEPRTSHIPQIPRHQYRDSPSSNTQYSAGHNVNYAGAYSVAGSAGTFASPQYTMGYMQPAHNMYQAPMGSYTAATGHHELYSPHQYSPISPQHLYFPTGRMSPSLQGPYGFGSGNFSGQRANNLPGIQTGQSRIFSTGILSNHLGLYRTPSTADLSSIPRGPPRKPKQSGFALWVGNLPPGANILDLKDHFSTDATNDIESLFLISKSNCAFVNYRTETACAAALQRFHDSRFHGVRLVCRLRRGSSAPPMSPEPTAVSGSTKIVSDVAKDDSDVMGDDLDGDGDTAAASAELDQDRDGEAATESTPTTGSGSGTRRAPEKFFIIKSLTLQDLEQSTRTGIWATQAHNEKLLNDAYSSADNVYLVFSANKSGEYFGYARMRSMIDDNASEIYQTMSPVESTAAVNAPRVISTPKSGTAPRGTIIDDSARGTIFWEAELSEDEKDEPAPTPTAATSGAEQAFGKPFKIEWMSTQRLPFYRTRGLRNAWNANREVKIARDGTELEPGVGKRLIALFHKANPQPGSQPNAMRPT